MIKYIKRLIDKEIDENLQVFGGVLIEGMKYCGKSTTCETFAKTVVRFQDNLAHHSIIQTDPSYYLNQPKPILFDEWQEVPEIWNLIRNDIDLHNYKSAYLLTGSSAPFEGAIKHTGIGRINKLPMSTMTLFETGESTGQVSLEECFSSSTLIRGESMIGIAQLSSLIVRGGFPASLNYNESQARVANKGYLNLLIQQDIRKLDGVNRNPEKMLALLKSYARNNASIASDQTIKSDMESEGIRIDDKTFVDYVNTLQKLFIIENIPAWSPQLRSKTAIRTASKKLISDTGIACAALGATNKKLLGDINTFGFFFEAFCLHDLKIYVRTLDGSLFHYRDKNGLEIDAIICLSDGRWGAIEIKLGVDMLDAAANNLRKFASKIAETVTPPSFLMIIYGGKYAFKRQDGVIVVPITCLKN